MPLYSDSRLAQIAQTRFCPDRPAAVVAKAHRIARLLEAAETWRDVDVFTDYAALPFGRYAAPVHGKWFITFNWSARGADEMKLEKL